MEHLTTTGWGDFFEGGVSWVRTIAAVAGHDEYNLKIKSTQIIPAQAQNCIDKS